MSDFGPPPPPDAGGPHDPQQPYPGPPSGDPGYPGASYPGQPYQGQPYQGQQYPGQQYPGAPRDIRSTPFTGLAARLGDRLVRRPEPRFGVGLAGAGVAMTLFGILLWGGTYWAHGVSNDLSTSRNLLGAALAAIVTVLGYVLAIGVRRGALVTAGVVAIGVGWPLALGFLTLDASNQPFPINIDAIFWVSFIAWLATYLWVPGARGHTVFVFLAAQGFYTYVVIKNVSDNTFSIAGSTGLAPRFHGVGTVAAISFFFGLGYYAIAFVLDRRGKHGPATGLVYPAFTAVSTGIVAWAPDIHRGGAGMLALVVGAAVCWYGGRYGRRFTCFVGAAGVAGGIFLLLAEATEDATVAGISFVVIGAVVVFIAGALSMATREPHDMDPEAVVRSR